MAKKKTTKKPKKLDMYPGGGYVPVGNHNEEIKNMQYQNSLNLAKAQYEAKKNPLAIGTKIAGNLAYQYGMANGGFGDGFLGQLGNAAIGLSTSMPSFAMGGNVQGNVPIEVEKQEVIEAPNGNMMQVDGPSHAQGGVDVNVPEGSMVYSDRIKVDNKSLAKHVETDKKRLDKAKKALEDNPTDEIHKKTVARLEANLEKKKAKFQQLQDIFNSNDPSKQSNVPIGMEGQQQFMYGGRAKYNNGGPVEDYYFGKEHARYLKALADYDEAMENDETSYGYGRGIKKYKNIIERYANKPRPERIDDPYAGKMQITEEDWLDVTPLSKKQQKKADRKYSREQKRNMRNAIAEGLEETNPMSLEEQDDILSGPSKRNKTIEKATQTPNQVPTIENPLVNRGEKMGYAPSRDIGLLNTDSQRDVLDYGLSDAGTGTFKRKKSLTERFNKFKDNFEGMEGMDLTGGDIMGMAGTLYSGFAPMLNTMKNRASDTVNTNMYKDYGKEGMEALSDAEKNMRGMFAENTKAIERQGKTSQAQMRSGARGINQLRMGDIATQQGMNQAKNEAWANFAQQQQLLDLKRMEAENLQDQMVMQGAEKADIANRMDKDNYATQLGADKANLGAMMQQMGSNLNTGKNTKETLQALEKTMEWKTLSEEDKTFMKQYLDFIANNNVTQKPQNEGSYKKEETN